MSISAFNPAGPPVDPTVGVTLPVVDLPSGNVAPPPDTAGGAITPRQRNELVDKAIQSFTQRAGVTVEKPVDPTSRLNNAQQVFLALQEKAQNNPSATNVAALTEYTKTIQDIGALGEGAVNYGLPAAEKAVSAITGKPVDASRSMEALTLAADSDHNGKLSRQELLSAQADARTPLETKALDAALDALDGINAERGEAGDGALSRRFVTEALRDKVIDGDLNELRTKPKQQP